MSTTLHIPASALIVLQPSQHTYEEHFVIRFPPSLAASVRSDLQETGLPGDLEINFSQTDTRLAKVKFDGRSYSAVLCDLPTILETHKTTDRSQYTKVADIHQILIVLDGSADAVRQKIEQYRAKDFQLDDGLTPPMKNVRNRKFSKKLAENTKRMEEIEKAVQRMLAADEKAISSNYTLYNSQGKPVKMKEPGKKKGAAVEKDETQDVIEDMDIDEAVETEVVEESGDSDFAAELEEDLLGDANEEAEQEFFEEAAEDTAEPEETFPPHILQLQKQIDDKKAQLSTMTNPAIRERIEDLIRVLEQDLQNKLANL